MMNLADYFRRQFVYNTWANQEVLRAMRAAGAGSEKSIELFSHVLAAERVWLDRLLQRVQSVPVWPEPDLPWCEAQTAEMNRLWIAYLARLQPDDFSQSISYKNSKGEMWSSQILDVLTHVIMHSAYHRGQIALRMRDSGQTPAYTDFIHSVRNGMVA